MTYPQQQGPLPGYPQPGGYGPPKKKPNTGLVVGIVGAVVVAVLGLVLVLVLTGDDDESPGTAGGGGTPPGAGIPDPTLDYTATDTAPSAGAPEGGADDGPGTGPAAGGDDGPSGSADPWELVQSMARIFETHDVDALQDYACDARSLTFFEKDLGQLEGVQVEAEAKDINETSATEAEATIAMELDVQGSAQPYPLLLAKADGVWCAQHKWAN